MSNTQKFCHSSGLHGPHEWTPAQWLFPVNCPGTMFGQEEVRVSTNPVIAAIDDGHFNHHIKNGVLFCLKDKEPWPCTTILAAREEHREALRIERVDGMVVE